MTLIVVVATIVCAHVQTLQITYIKYVQFFAYQVYLTSCLKKHVKTTSSHPHNSQTIHTHAHKNSTKHSKNHMCSNPMHKYIKRSNMCNPSTHTCIADFWLSWSIIITVQLDFPQRWKYSIAVFSNTAAPVSCDYWSLEI